LKLPASVLVDRETYTFVLVVLLFSFRSAIALLGSTVAVFVYQFSAVDAFVLMVMWAVAPFWSVPPQVFVA